MSRLKNVLAAIDAVHGEDPNHAELLYAERMSAWLHKLWPEASEALQIAVRAQHLKRWDLPRSEFPVGRIGYKRWRSEQARRHAALTAELLQSAGYDQAMIERVSALIQKQRLKQDAEAQVLEDVACLTFLAHEFAAFAVKHDDDKLCEILRKTWDKMSERARAEALKMSQGARETELLRRALSTV